MRSIQLKKADIYGQLTDSISIPKMERQDYEDRLSRLRNRMKDHQISHAVVYGDQVHFANLQYLIGHDPRFEEALLIVSQDQEPTLIVGNEGFAHSFQSPVPLKRLVYQNFSLQGQPRDELIPLSQLFHECGIGPHCRVGVIGFKYFSDIHLRDAEHRSDVPAYVLEELYELLNRKQVINFTSVMTHCDQGLRTVLTTAGEIAFYEAACHRSSNAVIRMLHALRPGISELELCTEGRFDGSPLIMHPFMGFGDEHVSIGLHSPSQRRLSAGELIMLCYGIRGSLVCKSGLAIDGPEALTGPLSDCLETFYKPFFRAITTWYEALSVGASCGEIYEKVMAIIGDRDLFHVVLNPGHNISDDEWTNSPFFPHSTSRLRSGVYLQSDMIASKPKPHLQAILEDGVVVAGPELRRELEQQYPDVFSRIMERKRKMREILGIRVGEDVLPLSNCQGVLHPFLLDPFTFFAWES